MEDPFKFAAVIILGCLVMFSLIVTVFLFILYYQRKLLLRENKIRILENETQIKLFKATSEIEEKEKERIFRNLHDEVNPILRKLHRNIEKYKFTVTRNELTPEELADDVILVQRIGEGIRTSAYDLIPSFMLDFGLIKSLKETLSRLVSPDNISAGFTNLSAFGKDLPFTRQEQLNLYRLCLELINNILKHGNCSKMNVTVSATESNFIIDIEHNGKGISNEEIEVLATTSKGQGIKSTRARALLLAAKIDYRCLPGDTGVKVTIPFAQ